MKINMNFMCKIANLDPQYHTNMVPLIFVQEWGHFSVIFAYKILKLCDFLLKNQWFLTPVFVQIDRYVSLHQNGRWNYTSDWSSKRQVATGLGLVFQFSQNPSNHNCGPVFFQSSPVQSAVFLQS